MRERISLRNTHSLKSMSPSIMSSDKYTIRSFLGLKHPVSGLLHLLGFVLSILGLVWLLSLPTENRHFEYFFSAFVFSISMALLYLSSSFYHLIKASDKLTRILRKINHSMIFIFIAGSCTQFCLSFPSLITKCLAIALIWTVSLGGVFFSTIFATASRWIRVGSYLAMGGVGAFLAVQIRELLSPESFRWIIFGGVAYILGSFIYALKWPNPFPKYFGFHEIWHIFVLVGSACHFWAVELHLQWAFA